jgi:hypothetical protein
MALVDPQSVVRLSRMRVQFGIDSDTDDYCYEVALFGEDMKGVRKLVIDMASIHVVAAELEACAAVLKAHIAVTESLQTQQFSDDPPEEA